MWRVIAVIAGLAFLAALLLAIALQDEYWNEER